MVKILPTSSLSFLWYFLKQYKKYFFSYVCIAFLAGFWNPLNFYLVSYLVSLLSDPNLISLSKISFFSFLIVLNFIVFDNLTWRGVAYLKSCFLPYLLNGADNQLLAFILHHSYSFFQERMAGSITKQIFSVLDSLEKIIADIIPHLCRMVSLLLIALFLSYRVHYVFFFVLLVWIFLFTFISIYFFDNLEKLSEIQASKESILGGQIADSVTNSFNVKVFTGIFYETKRRNNTYKEYVVAYKNREKYNILINFIEGFLISFVILIGIIILIFLYKKKLILGSDFIFVLTLYMEVGHMMWWTVDIVQNFRNIVAKSQEALNLLLVPFEVIDNKDAKKLVHVSGNIIFDLVSFGYKKSNMKIFDRLSVSIGAGEKVGLVGFSGGGKSTFVNLILRLFDVQEGSIRIDGNDIQFLTQDSLRENIAIIPQDTSLFHRSLLENIRYGNIFASDEAVFEAAKKAYVNDFIDQLPDGYNTLVGERGLKLSGGQRQRIALARAFLKNAPILILDEATSALDSYSEKLIQKSLDVLMTNKTTIVIAHRLSTLIKMDRILVFDKGKIIEAGSHEELLMKKGMYAKLWSMQLGDFIHEEFNYE